MVADTQIALMQLVGFTIPAIGIYMYLFASQSTAERPLQTDTIYSAKLAALAFIGAAVLLVIVTVGGSSYLSPPPLARPFRHHRVPDPGGVRALRRVRVGLVEVTLRRPSQTRWAFAVDLRGKLHSTPAMSA